MIVRSIGYCHQKIFTRRLSVGLKRELRTVVFGLVTAASLLFLPLQATLTETVYLISLQAHQELMPMRLGLQRFSRELTGANYYPSVA
jgi:hypothetical protein